MSLLAPDDSPDIIPFPGPARPDPAEAVLSGLINQYEAAAGTTSSDLVAEFRKYYSDLRKAPRPELGGIALPVIARVQAGMSVARVIGCGCSPSLCALDDAFLEGQAG